MTAGILLAAENTQKTVLHNRTCGPTVTGESVAKKTSGLAQHMGGRDRNGQSEHSRLTSES